MTEIHGWGRYPRADADVVAPATRSAAIGALAARDGGSLIARGLGRSYGDSSLAPHVLATRFLDCFIEFDATSGVVRCEAGVSLAELLVVIVPRGWFLPVTPGTKFVTIAGAIASDVHGKNHHVAGCFSEFVERFDLLMADGSVVTCTQHSHADLFRATCGGMGLTGVVLEATLRLQRIGSALIRQTTFKVSGLDELLALFASEAHCTYSVAWVDSSAGGRALGRGLLMTGEHSPDGSLAASAGGAVGVPLDMPAGLLNRYSIRALNSLTFHRPRGRRSEQLLPCEKYFYPLDRILNWNRLYGRGGFTQYQFVIPGAAGAAGLRAIMQRIASSRHASFVSVLKVFGRRNDNLLSFPLEGYTLALDFRIAPGLFELLDELDAMVLDYGGRLYLAKDARMSEATFKRSYDSWQQFQSVRERYGAAGRFVSQQSRRLGLD